MQTRSIKKKFYYVYILLCSDKTYYTGMTNDLERRLIQHKSGHRKDSYTSTRLPIKLVSVFNLRKPKRSY
ncbi:GIY-YIG nuclease family protein [Lacinutrix neustonica]|uniref:GIY-YIG nuclease family protein n=1 Tax=Lacinutrix neustonica TaxID=2980107 RepID=UPI0028BE4F37|nr:GIY-YIG nuclease family protein [Lacinutrix neustonica]